MLEALLVFGVLAILILAGILTLIVNWATLIIAGAVLVAIGTVVGVPAGFWYHVRLYAHLAPRGELPARWWVSPVQHHEKLLDGERPDVLRWFYVGGAGFMVILLGCVVVALGVLVAP